MSKDIRSFFKIDNSKTRINGGEISSIEKKKNAFINNFISSDKGSNSGTETKEKRMKKKRVIESDEEEKDLETSGKKKKSQVENEITNIGSVFGGVVKRTERPKVSNKAPEFSAVKNEIKDIKPIDYVKEVKNSVTDRTTAKEESKDAKAELVAKKSDADKAIKTIDQISLKKEREPSAIESDQKPPVLQNPLVSQQPPILQKPSSTNGKSVQPKTSSITPSPPTLSEYSFVDKYKPTTVKEIIGQQGAQSNAQKLQKWLLNWHKNHAGSSKHKSSSASSFGKNNNDGSSFKAALLSGSPGVGKTTTAHLVAKESLFDVVEFNASDTRSKKLLKEEVAHLIANKSLRGYVNGDEGSVSKRHVLIMDEVDGMAGNEDRGGIAELIQLIKDSKIPVICMCNDRSHPKIRSLVNYCYDLRFFKPSINQMRSSMMSICFKEGIKIEPGAVDAIISGTGNDVRQTLNHLALYSAKRNDMKISTEHAKKNAQMSEKDIKIGPWDVVRKVFSADEHRNMSLNDKSDLFFYDYNIAPLFVQENYLRVRPECGEREVLIRIAKTADALSLGDTVDKRIRSNMAWSLLPTQAIFCSVLPGQYMEGSFKSPPVFPTWLGKNSKAQKRKRLAQELHEHTRTVTSGSRTAIRLDYGQFLIRAIIAPLKEKGVEGVPEALEVMKSYHLLREDIESLIEITSWSSEKSPWEQIDSKVRAALTRAYNKHIQPYTYSVQTDVKKKKVSYEDEEVGDENDHLDESDIEDNELIESNSMIKVKKPTTAKLSKTASAKGKIKK